MTKLCRGESECSLCVGSPDDQRQEVRGHHPCQRGVQQLGLLLLAEHRYVGNLRQEKDDIPQI